jgi:predicted nucleotidyltransferase
MTAVPSEYIVRHYKPEEKMAQLMTAKRPDALQKKAARFVAFLSEKADVPSEYFGVTGSILLNIHRLVVSDMDLTVYGSKNSLKIKDALLQIYSQRTGKIKRFEGAALNAWCRKKATVFPMTLSDAYNVYKRKWNFGVFEDTDFSIHPVKLEEEVNEEYADKIFEPLGAVVLGAVIVENSDSLFLPAVYRIQDARIIKGPQISDVEEVVSYEGLYGDIAEIGETILVKGKLELVHDKKNRRKYHRVVVGSPEGKGTEYIKLA